MKKNVYEANRQLKDSGLIVLTWGNVSQIDRKNGYIVIANMDGSLMTYSTMYDIADRILGVETEESWHDRWRAKLDSVIEASEPAAESVAATSAA